VGGVATTNDTAAIDAANGPGRWPAKKESKGPFPPQRTGSMLV